MGIGPAKIRWTKEGAEEETLLLNLDSINSGSLDGLFGIEKENIIPKYAVEQFKVNDLIHVWVDERIGAIFSEKRELLYLDPKSVKYQSEKFYHFIRILTYEFTED